PGPGIYTIMLIANPTWTCADTAMTVWQVYPPMEPDIVVSGGDCVNNQVLYNFTYTASASASATVQWNFGMGSSPSGSTAPFPSGVALNPEANEHLVTLSITDNGCTETDTQVIANPPEPMAAIEPQDSFCDGFTYTFTSGSVNAQSWY
ncbi:MAG: hypothetical protein ACK54P_07315, partial [Bacteroidota bacterium]